jgi:hypothetical protein
MGTDSAACQQREGTVSLLHELPGFIKGKISRFFHFAHRNPLPEPGKQNRRVFPVRAQYGILSV